MRITSLSKFSQFLKSLSKTIDLKQRLSGSSIYIPLFSEKKSLEFPIELSSSKFSGN